MLSTTKIYNPHLAPHASPKPDGLNNAGGCDSHGGAVGVILLTKKQLKRSAPLVGGAQNATSGPSVIVSRTLRFDPAAGRGRLQRGEFATSIFEL